MFFDGQSGHCWIVVFNLFEISEPIDGILLNKIWLYVYKITFLSSCPQQSKPSMQGKTCEQDAYYLGTNNARCANNQSTCRTSLNQIQFCLPQVIDIAEIKFVKDLSMLRELNLLRNPIQQLPDYRLLILYRIPKLKDLDRKKVDVKEKVRFTFLD